MRLGYTITTHELSAACQERHLLTFLRRPHGTHHKPIGPFHGTVGFQALASDFSATDFGGLNTIVPKSLINSYGVFGVESFNYGPVTYQLGARVEESSIDPQAGTNYLPPNGMPISYPITIRQSARPLQFVENR